MKRSKALRAVLRRHIAEERAAEVCDVREPIATGLEKTGGGKRMSFALGRADFGRARAVPAMDQPGADAMEALELAKDRSALDRTGSHEVRTMQSESVAQF